MSCVVAESDPPFKLEVFEDYLYVLTFHKYQLLRLHKFGRTQNHTPVEPQVVYTGLEHISAIVVAQDQKMNNDCKSPPTFVWGGQIVWRVE